MVDVNVLQSVWLSPSCTIIIMFILITHVIGVDRGVHPMSYLLSINYSDFAVYLANRQSKKSMY